MAQITPEEVAVDDIAPVTPFPVVVVDGFNQIDPSAVILTEVIVKPLKIN
jgi:hypothetical protein